MLIRRVFLTVTAFTLTVGLLGAQTVADVARQNRAEKKTKRIYTSEDMAPAKTEVIVPQAAAESKPATSSSKKKKKEQAEAAAAAAAAASSEAAAAEAQSQEKAKFEEVTAELTHAERAVSEARQRSVEVGADPNATDAQKSSAKEAVEAADARRKELNAAFLAQRKKAGAAPKVDDASPPPQKETPQ